MHVFDTNFGCIVRVGQSGCLSTLLKASDVFFLFSADGNILSWSCGELELHKNGFTAPDLLWCKVQDEYAWLYKYCLCSLCISGRRQSLCIYVVTGAEFIFQVYEIISLICYVNSFKEHRAFTYMKRENVANKCNIRMAYNVLQFSLITCCTIWKTTYFIRLITKQDCIREDSSNLTNWKTLIQPIFAKENPACL